MSEWRDEGPHPEMKLRAVTWGEGFGPHETNASPSAVIAR